MNGVGRVLGTDDATPLEFWVALGPGHHLQLDDVVAVDRELPNGDKIKLYGIVSQVRAAAGRRSSQPVDPFEGLS